MRSPTIVLVDDDEMILAAIKSLLAMDMKCELRAYTSPGEAIGEIGTRIHPVDLIISDYVMPEMDGIAFLARVKDMFPLAPRILLTGYADKESAIRAINTVGLYQYIEKPWDNEDLRLIVRNGLEKAALLRQLEEKAHEVEKAYTDLHAVQKDILRVFV